MPRRCSADPADPVPAEDTRTRILEVAERLFAERGIEVVSVRSILAEAGVNVALAHYHFGSREGLIAELLRTRVTSRVEPLLRSIAEVDERGADATLEDVLRAYFAPMARWLGEQPRLARIVAQLLASPSERIRSMGRNSMRQVMLRFGEAVMKRLPGHLEPKRVFLRFYLVIGAITYVSGSWEDIGASARRHFGPDVSFDPDELAEELVTFSAAGLRAEAAGRGKRSSRS
jgi:AcrR family transcriptional regulator